MKSGKVVTAYVTATRPRSVSLADPPVTYPTHVTRSGSP